MTRPDIPPAPKPRPGTIGTVVIFMILMMITALSSCNGLGQGRYYSATISGYVNESKLDANGNTVGVNGAQVSIYLVDPSLNAKAVPSIVTSSMTSGNNAGYWSHKVMWQTATPSFADEGDSGTVWVKVMSKGYFPQTVEVNGILSDASNVVSTIALVKIVTTELKGRVVNKDGAGVNGVNVVLDLMSTEDNEADYSATTATVDGVMGVFTFSNIAWEDTDSKPRLIGSDGKATETIKLYIDDPNYYSDSNSADPRYKTLQTAFGITSGSKFNRITSNPISVYSAAFSAKLLKGRVVDIKKATAALLAGTALGASDGINKVTIALLFPIQGGNPVTVTTGQLGGADGWFQFDTTNATWTNNRPTHSDATVTAEGAYVQGAEDDDVTTARIYLNDGNFYSDNDTKHPLEVAITSEGSIDLSTLATPLAITAGDARFKVATVKGQVLLRDKATGVNGVQVSLQLASGQNAINVTTANDGTNDGIFTFKDVTWTDTNPSDRAKEADTEEARLYISDANYNSDIVQASPRLITLDSSTTVDLTSGVTPTPLKVTMFNFNCPKVSGKVVNVVAPNNGIAGLTVVLHRQADATANNDVNATTDKDGAFTFSNVGWTNTKPLGDNSDTADIKLSVNSADYVTTTPIAIKTVSSDKDLVLTDSLVARRTTAWNYSVTLTGTASYRAAAADPSKDTTLGGITVTIDSADLDASLVTSARKLQVQTANDGTYTATITWTRAPDYVPPSDAAANGGDKLPLSVVFSKAKVTGTTELGSFTITQDLLSWSNNNIVNCVYQ